MQLAVLKGIAAPNYPNSPKPIQVKEWAYVGIALFFLTAIVAHMAHKDPFSITLINLVLIGILAVSYLYLHKSLKG